MMNYPPCHCGEFEGCCPYQIDGECYRTERIDDPSVRTGFEPRWPEQECLHEDTEELTDGVNVIQRCCNDCGAAALPPADQ